MRSALVTGVDGNVKSFRLPPLSNQLLYWPQQAGLLFYKNDPPIAHWQAGAYAMKYIRAILLIVAAVYFLSSVLDISGFVYSGDGFYTQGYKGDSRMGPLLVSMFCGLCYLCLVGYSHCLTRYGTSPVIGTIRKLVPVLFFSALTVLNGSYGVYYVALFVRELFSANVTAWRFFLVAELLLLLAWRFLIWTLIFLAVYRSVIKREQVRLRGGIIGRILFMVATGTVGFGYLMAKSLFQMPWWFTHVGHALVAVLMFCTFTYPSSRRQNITRDKTPSAQEPIAPPVLTKP